MKIPALLTCLLAAVLSALPLSQARAADVSFDVFYNSLADDGDWYNTPEYGYVWQPSIGYQNDKWRPYSDGYWAQTDEGWTWVSYENFGWATYHYGRWTRLENTGWVWVPGYDWGPGWVSWRSNDDYVGWAPLPPKRERRNSGSGGADIVVDYNTVESEEGYDNSVDEQYDIGPANYNFVACSDFGEPSLREVIVPQQRNVVIIENTVNITRITYDRGPQYVRVHNYGPDYVFLRTRVHRPIQELRLERRDNVDFLREHGRARHNPNVVRDGVFQIAAPNINRQRVNFNEVKPTRVREDLRDRRVEHGWRNSGADQATTERLRNQFQQQSRDRRDRQSNNPAANNTPVPNDPRRDRGRDRERDQVNVFPSPGASPATGSQPFNRTDDDRRNRRDAAQRDREAHENARNNGGQPTPGSERDSRRRPGTPDQPQPSATPQGNSGEDSRRRGPRQSDTPPAVTPPAPTPGADNPRGDRQGRNRDGQGRTRQDAQPTPAAENTPAGQDRRAEREQQQQQRQQAQQEQTRAREQQQQQRTQEQQNQRQQEQAQKQQQAQQRQQEQAQHQQEQSAQREQRKQEQQNQRQQEQAQRQQVQQAQQQRSQEQQNPRQQEQAQRQQQAQQQPQQRQQEQAQKQQQPQQPQAQQSPSGKSDDDKRKRRDGQPPQ